ncbi:MAG: 16S rRNA (adenine(1518)-N(6)/adenine(1519)-N(6))-dimethyltransferase [Bacteroidetes bacterium HGW-Bacteroidetes-21]|jgi:16S rRNA (adenine1518-N6/adenine1519-N6)-dimethyltransferase|nr:MAG: 16S rRNA (adenine(1518)-N(6)/adenine(1519)-N(6))-dimethyltransferase [Bacteroidetes bacterium HGW-Bacteroidetes-21]
MTDFVKPKKHLGQHFLTDKNIATKIAGSLLYQGVVLEIGPGKGMLTQFLVPIYGDNLWVAEIDPESVEYLISQKVLSAERIINKDILIIDPAEFTGSSFAMIGNLPYNISSQIFFRMLEFRASVPEAVFMIQKEVAERIAAAHGSKTYGILSVLLQAFYEVKYLFTVGEKVFNPPPKVKSAVIRLVRREGFVLDCNERLFYNVVKTSFNQRRKTLSNSLKPIMKPGQNPGRFAPLRAEQLSVQDFIELTKILSE